MIPAFPFFPFGKKGIKILYRSAGNRIPVAGLFHITFFLDMNIAHESKSNKTPLYLIGEGDYIQLYTTNISNCFYI